MKIFARGFLFALILFPLFACSAENRLALFSDDFLNAGLLHEKWVVKDGSSVKNGTMLFSRWGKVTPRIDLTNRSCTVVADLVFRDNAVAKKEKKNGHAGIVFDGIYFMRRTGVKGWSVVYTPSGLKRAKGYHGPIADFAEGKRYTFTITRTFLEYSTRYSFSINGLPAISFIDTMPRSQAFTLYAHNSDMEVHGVRVFAVTTGKVSPNLVVNSSFEYLQEGMPLFMNSLTGRGIPWSDYDAFFRNFRIVHSPVHSGKNALQLTVTDPKIPNCVRNYGAEIAIGKPVTGSLWACAREPVDAELFFWEKYGKYHSRKIRIERGWQRYSITVPSPQKGAACIGLSLNQAGVVWIDDLQIEQGDKLSPWSESSLDAEKLKNKKTVASVQSPYNVPLLALNPKIDGDLKDFPTSQSLKITDFLYRGKLDKVRNRTTVWLFCGKDHLYIAFRAYMQNPEKIRKKAEKDKRDSMDVFSDDAVEIQIDSNNAKKEFIQYALGASGAKTDLGPGRRIAWNGDWQGAVRFNPAEKSYDYEIAIPFSDVASSNLSYVWGMNLCRTCKEFTQELSLTKTDVFSYHLMELFPLFRLPEKLILSYRLGFENAALIRMGDKQYFNMTLMNAGGLTGKAEIELTDPQTGIVFGKGTLQLKGGLQECVIFAQKDLPGKVGLVYAKLIRNGRPLSSAILPVERRRTTDIFFRQNFYSQEKNAELCGKLALPNLNACYGELQIAEKKFIFKNLSTDLRLTLPLQEIPIGNHRGVFRIFDDKNAMLAQENITLNKFAPSTQSVPVDYLTRSLVIDGKPRVVVAPHIGIHQEGLPRSYYAAMTQTFKDAGFESVLLGAKTEHAKSRDVLIAELEKRGIKVIMYACNVWQEYQRRNEKMDMKEVFAPLSQKNIIAFYMLDEPELYLKPAFAEHFMKDLRGYMKRVPVFMNNTVVGIPSRYAGQETDIVGVDDYLTNSESRTMQQMYETASAVEKAGRGERKPGFFFMAGATMHHHHREPTCQEQLAQGYCTIISGCTMVAYFLGEASWPGNWAGMKQFAKEMKALNDVILSPEAAGSVKSLNKEIKFISRSLKGRNYLIAVNPSEKEITAEFSIPDAGQAEVLFEGRRIRIQNKILRDKFRPNDRHVYLLYK